MSQVFQGIWLKNYRNLNEAIVRFSPQVNIFLGDNGQGKTNLLEALYLCSRGQSFRYADNENLIQKNQEQAVIKAKLIQNELSYDLQIQILKSKKNYLLNQKKIQINELQKTFPAVLFSPESLSAIKEGGDQRRELLDDIVCSIRPSATQIQADFRKALKTRNKVLKTYHSGETPLIETMKVLESLNPIFLRLAAEVTNLRLMAIRDILPEFQRAMHSISRPNDEKIVDLSVDYVISGQKALKMSAKEVENLLISRASELKDAELASGLSLVGPQKHDVIFLYDENDSRFYCSQGQQRALILALKMAQIVYHKQIHRSYPVLLLDDVLSELDADKREALIRFLSEINTQIFITTTDLTLPENLGSGNNKASNSSETVIGNSSVVNVIRIQNGEIQT